MTSQDFSHRWKEIADEILNAPFRVVEAAQVDSLQIPANDKQWLRQTGLPTETCSFRLDLFPPLRRPYEHFVTGDWTEGEKESVDDCWVLGEDGGGNAICFTEPKGEVWLLDHQFLFQERNFINSSIAAFTEFLLLDLEGFMGTLTYHQAFERMQQIDSTATQSHTANGVKTYWRQAMLDQIQDEDERD